MASSNNNPNPNPNFHSLPNTTFVQADPSSFRAVVQQLTGASPPKLAGKSRPAFKLHERRPTARKLEITLNNGGACSTKLHSPSARSHRIFIGDMVSPVSPLEYLAAAARGSPKTPRSPMEEEEKAIAEKGFYLHPSPLSTPRGSDPPELLPLFPLHSPKDYNYNYNSSS